MDEANTREMLELLRQLANATGVRDGFDVANLVISALSAIATTALAGLAAYIAWMSHNLERSSASARTLSERFATRERFRHDVEQHLTNIRFAWVAPKKKRPEHLSFDTSLALRAFSMTIPKPDAFGALSIATSIDRLEKECADWPLSRAEDFGAGLSDILINTTLWARDPEDWKESDEGREFLQRIRDSKATSDEA